MSVPRLRPTLHFTPAQGWMNDPHGVVFDGLQWHLFYQYVPGGTEWKPDLSWGHAVSEDLVNWQEIEPAIDPRDEVGCWSGSVVFDHHGVANMFYTRPTEGDWGTGQVVAAIGSPDLRTWKRDPATSLIVGPEQGHGFFDFRDPNVRRAEDGYVMVIGAGIRDLGGAALQYSSSDLRAWHFDGVLASRSSALTDPLYTGTIWECPQFIEVGGEWVLIVSAMEDGPLRQVQYAIGAYDGRQFTARTWGVFGLLPAAYATTTFRDREGRPCAITWLKERDEIVPPGSPWASAQSVASVLRIEGDRLVLDPHPDLEEYCTDRTELLLRDGFEDMVGSTWRLRLEPRGRIDITVGGIHPWRIDADFAGERLTATDASGAPLFDVPLPKGEAVLDIIVDADICEIFWAAGEGWAAARVPANVSGPLILSGEQITGELRK